ncbi:heme o synthase [Sulfuriflexus sp.]|uniref:heme o synthase n=1 Tax=Sulfuriflexus sp. TaxID=2015443 RepID=UPI0028CDE872|nr:heme o synthase [Sulfuriflexus sp.]MDT8403570.1 heme o synthase [Sulfuriflexus sp.]
MTDTTQTAEMAIGWRDYLELCKPKVVALIMFTALVGMFLAVPGMVPWQPLVFGSIGIALASASAATINHVVDQRIDAIMARTKNRPLPTGHMDNGHALAFAVIIGTIAMLILYFLVNTVTMILTFASLIGYAVIYTMYLKRATPQNIVIGGAAGAAPPVLGWSAVTGDINEHSLLLFLIIFAWTPPHFWALAIHRHKEYAKVEIPMLPVTHGLAFTRLQILLYTIILIIVTILPFVTLMSGVFYLGGALALGLGFLYYAIATHKAEDETMPIKTFGYSIFYLMALFAFLLIDHYIPLIMHALGG